MPTSSSVISWSFRPKRNIKTRICGIRTFLQTRYMCGDVQGFLDREIKELFEQVSYLKFYKWPFRVWTGPQPLITIKKTLRTGTQVVLRMRCEFHVVLMTL